MRIGNHYSPIQKDIQRRVLHAQDCACIRCVEEAKTLLPLCISQMPQRKKPGSARSFLTVASLLAAMMALYFGALVPIFTRISEKVTEVYNNHSDDADVDAKVDMLKTFINDSNNLIHVLFLVAVGYLAVVVIIWILLLRRDRAVIKNERDFWYATITQLQTVIVGGIKSSDSCQGVADKSKVSSNQKQKASDGCTLPEDDS